MWIWIIVIVKDNSLLLDNVILLTIATDYTQHLSLQRPRPYLHDRSVGEMQIEKRNVCVYQFIKPVLVPVYMTQYKTLSLLTVVWFPAGFKCY